METKPTNTNACVHDWQSDPWTPGMETCDCGQTREAPAPADDAVRVVCVAVDVRAARVAA